MVLYQTQNKVIVITIFEYKQQCRVITFWYHKELFFDVLFKNYERWIISFHTAKSKICFIISSSIEFHFKKNLMWQFGEKQIKPNDWISNKQALASKFFSTFWKKQFLGHHFQSIFRSRIVSFLSFCRLSELGILRKLSLFTLGQLGTGVQFITL